MNQEDAGRIEKLFGVKPEDKNLWLEYETNPYFHAAVAIILRLLPEDDTNEDWYRTIAGDAGDAAFWSVYGHFAGPSADVTRERIAQPVPGANKYLGELVDEMEREAGPASQEAYDRVLNMWGEDDL